MKGQGKLKKHGAYEIFAMETPDSLILKYLWVNFKRENVGKIRDILVLIRIFLA